MCSFERIVCDLKCPNGHTTSSVDAKDIMENIRHYDRQARKWEQECAGAW